MKCPKCGAILEEDSKFCASCGANLDGLTEATPIIPDLAKPDASESQQKRGDHSKQKAQPSKNNKMIGLIAGTIIIAIGIVRIMSAGTSISSTSFGGDFYTYTYQGIVAVSEILASIEVSLGWIIVAIGTAIDVYSLRH